MGGLSNAAECLRFMIYTINLLMVISSFALIVSCGFLLGKHDILVEILGPNTAWILVTIIMVTAIIIFLVSLLGCCGAMKENTCMLKTYICVMLTLLVLLLVVAGLAYGYQDPVREKVSEHMKGKMQDYIPNDKNSSVTTFWDELQPMIQCCGIDNSSDWSMYNPYYNATATSNSTSDLLFPKSCLQSGSQDEAYPSGCLDRAETWIRSNIWILVGIIAAVVLATMLAMCCVCKLIRTINQYDEFDVEPTGHQSLRW